MASMVQFIRDFHDYIDKYADPRTTNWFLMSSPFYTIGICLFYVYLVKSLLPRFMENRRPMKLKRTLIVYNLLQIIISTWIFYELGMAAWFGHYSFRCQPVDYGDNPMSRRITRISWLYFMSKFTEFFDTIFFVLRKKYSQVSRLHVIHHAVMPFSTWPGVKFVPGGHSTFFGFINVFVHMIMYTYYFLAACGPRMQKYLKWKKYLTALQMVQFVLIVVHALQLLFIDCDYPIGFAYFIAAHAILFFFLFKQFYQEAYTMKSHKKKNR